MLSFYHVSKRRKRLDVLEELEEMGDGEVIMMDGFSDAIKGY